jgi:uncharacterized alpha-E superfamily protein
VRDQLSLDTWIALNGLDRGLRLAGAGPAENADRLVVEDLPGALEALLGRQPSPGLPPCPGLVIEVGS